MWSIVGPVTIVVGCSSVGDEVVRADIGRLHPQRARREVDDPLARPRLRLPRAAERDVGPGVRRDHGALERVVGDPVRVREQHAHEVQDDRGREHGDRVRALVHRPCARVRRGSSRPPRREIDRDHVVARVARGEQVLDAVFDPLHRARELASRDTHRDLLATRVRLLPERAADVATPHRDEVGWVIEQRGHRQAQRVRVLVRDVDHQLAGSRQEVGEDRAPFHRHVGHALLRERLRHDRRAPARTRRRRRRRCRTRWYTTFVPSSSNSSALDGSSASSIDTTAGSGSMSTSTSSHASSASARLSATTIASGSPVHRTLSSASTGGPARGTPAARAAGACATRPSSSRALAAMSTPGAARAAAHVDRSDAAVRDVAPHERGVEDAGDPDVVDVVALAGDETRVFDPRGARRRSAQPRTGGISTQVRVANECRIASITSMSATASANVAGVGSVGNGAPPMTSRNRS